MRRPVRLTGLLTIALMLIAAMPPLAVSGSAQEASPAPDEPPPAEGVKELPTADATIRITLLGCEDGVDPRDTPERCDTPVTAPESAIFAIAPDMATHIHTVPGEEEEAYAAPVFPSEEITLEAFDRPDYNFFMFEGVDEQERWTGALVLEPGETRDITVFYWNGPDGLIEPGENAVSVTVLGCPDGVDPNEDAGSCVEPIDAPLHLLVSLPDETSPLGRYPRDEQGTYTFSDLPPYSYVSVITSDAGKGDTIRTLITGDAESITSDGAEVYAIRGETRELTVYTYDRSGGVDGADAGTISVSVWECPEGVDPGVDASACTTPMEVPDSARVMHRQELLDVPLAGQPRSEDGAYLIEGVIPEAYAIGGLFREGHAPPVVEGLTESELVGNVIEVLPGETTEIQVYYVRD